MICTLKVLHLLDFPLVSLLLYYYILDLLIMSCLTWKLMGFYKVFRVQLNNLVNAVLVSFVMILKIFMK